jgi:L-malate glycosyltransferase
MKIAVFISSLQFGGAEKQTVIDAALLSKVHQVCFLIFQEGPLMEQLPGDVELIVLKKTDYFSTARRLTRVLKSKQIDIVHAHLYAPMVISSLSTLWHSIPVIFNFHGHAYDSNYYEKLVPGLVSRLPAVKKVLFPASELKHYYRAEKIGFPTRKEQIFFNSGQFWGRQPYKDNAGEPITVGYIGRIVPLKRIHLLVRLAKELKTESQAQVRIGIVGDGDSLPAIREQARAEGVDGMIDFHGFQADTARYYNQFSIFALPSEEECLSLSLIDAQLIGLPCVAFDVGGNRDIVEHGTSGYIVQEPREFLDRIKMLIHDPALRNEMGRRAIEQSSEKFSQSRRVNQLENLYQSAVNS